MKINQTLVPLVLLAIGFSCQNKSLDPFQTDKLDKGVQLALRGTQLDNIYFNGVAGAVFSPKTADGTETFSFDAEFLATDVNSLDHAVVYVVKRKGKSDTTRVKLQTVQGSSFKQTNDYLRPWTTISIGATQIITALGLDASKYPLPKVTVDSLLKAYKGSVNIETDLYLKGGKTVPANTIIAAGLFQSDQFYPAQRLTYTMVDYCPYDANSWSGSWFGTQSTGSNATTLVQDGTDPNKYTMDNFLGKNVSAYIVFKTSTNPFGQPVSLPKQTTSDGAFVRSSDGSYDQCAGTFSLTLRYIQPKKDTVTIQYDFSR